MIADGFCLLVLLLAGHAVADYPLQCHVLGRAKNCNTELGRVWWPYALTLHALIHGFFVGILTSSAALATAEVTAHWLTDWSKCRGRIGLYTDQALHVICKVVWCSITVGGLISR